jgi:hypothetical protein
MGSVTFVHTFSGSEPKPGLIESYPSVNWTGTFTATFVISLANSGEIFNIDYRLVRSATSSVCFASSSTMFHGSETYTETWTVGVTGPWSCTDWDTFELRYGTASDRVPAGRVLTVTFDGPGIGVPAGGAMVGLTQVSILG